jgi:hypothetical protein
LDEEIGAKQCISPFRFCLDRLPKKQIAGIDKEDFSPLAHHLTDQGCLLGHTAKGIPESPAGLHLTHHIIRVDDAELDFGVRLERRHPGYNQNENRNENGKDFMGLHKTFS